MYYLTDTSIENGCLRVIPGSHIHRHELHDNLNKEHAEYRRIDDPKDIAYRKAAGEIDLPVNVGDLVIGDSRLLHSSHANKSEKSRTVVTLWYFPDFDELPEAIRASFNGDGRHAWPDGWPDRAKEIIEPFRPIYNGEVAPVKWHRIPSAKLR